VTSGRPRKVVFMPKVPPNSLLTALQRTDDEIDNSGNRYEVWLCRCKCGNLYRVRLQRLESGTTKSCGCLRREMGKERIKIARAAHVEAARQRRIADGR